MTKKEFKNCVLPAQDKLFRLAVALLGNRDEAEDIIQDVYLKLWNMRKRLSGYSSIEALAVTITKNLCLDKLRSYRSRNQNEGGLEFLNEASPGMNPRQKMEVNESVQYVHQIIQGLPERQRLIIHLRDVEQYSYEEIAEMTGLKINNIRVALSRARKEVRRKCLIKQNYEHSKN
ncbi:MAG TPA: RNA polymerase sigma factor [Balneolaceae bacterium]|nr:RNA polymerase sigma factor [Balneolaceae bacterium]